VETVGGGYFFMPSRAALRYLADEDRPSVPPPLAGAAEKPLVASDWRTDPSPPETD
jgi:hypothetical protein